MNPSQGGLDISWGLVVPVVVAVAFLLVMSLWDWIASSGDGVPQAVLHPTSGTTRGCLVIREGRFVNDQILPWFESSEFRKMVREFHDRHAKIPDKEMGKANNQLYNIMQRVCEDLREHAISSGLKCTGSSFEGLKIRSTPLEYDVMVILNGGEDLRASSTSTPGYDTLTPSYWTRRQFRGQLDDGFRERRLSAIKTRSWFYGEIEKCIKNRLRLHCEIHDDSFIVPVERISPQYSELLYGGHGEAAQLRAHGPAIQLDITDQSEKMWFSIDVVPTYEVGGQLYVPKPLKETSYGGGDDCLWRRSFSLEEKKLLQGLDKDGGCRRECARVLKALCHLEAPFRKMQSYFIKTALIHADREVADWHRDYIGVRLVQLMRRLSQALKDGKLEHAFVAGWNIMTDYSDIQRENMYSRIDHLLNSESQLRKKLVA